MKPRLRDFVLLLNIYIYIFTLYTEIIQKKWSGRYHNCFLCFSKYGIRSVPFIVSFDTEIVTGYLAEVEFLCDKTPMSGDAIIKTLYILILPLSNLGS
jgi:hypothetical protein